MDKREAVLYLVMAFVSLLFIGIGLGWAWSDPQSMDYFSQSQWDHDPLSFNIINMVEDKPQYSNLTRLGFYTWSENLKLQTDSPNFNFNEMASGSVVDIRVVMHDAAYKPSIFQPETFNTVGTTQCYPVVFAQQDVLNDCVIHIYTKYWVYSEHAQKWYLRYQDDSQFTTVILHEVGHSIGLGHTHGDNMSCPIDIMNAETFSCSDISQLDIDAILYVYDNDGFGGDNNAEIPIFYHDGLKS